MELNKKIIAKHDSVPLKITLTNNRKDVQHICLFSVAKNSEQHKGLVVEVGNADGPFVPSYDDLSRAAGKYNWEIGLIAVDSVNKEQLWQSVIVLEAGETLATYTALPEIEKHAREIVLTFSLNDIAGTHSEAGCNFEIGNGQDIYYQLLGETSVDIFLYPSARIKK